MTDDKKIPLSVIILTFNEEKNIEACLKSVSGWADEIFVVDSFSTDRTIEIAQKYTDRIYQHPFTNYSVQRNWAQDNLPLKNAWVFHLDTDERVTPELREELNNIFAKPLIGISGFLVSRRTIFMGKWIKHGGHYPVYHLRIFKRSAGRCEKRRYHQHFIVEGKVLKLRGDILDILAPNLTMLIERLNRWSTLEAKELLQKKEDGQIKADLFGTPIERRRWLRIRLYGRFPLFVRPALYFIYRYFIRLGFLDGMRGFSFHFLQGFWQYFLIDAKIYEFLKKQKRI